MNDANGVKQNGEVKGLINVNYIDLVFVILYFPDGEMSKDGVKEKTERKSNRQSSEDTKGNSKLQSSQATVSESGKYDNS